MEGTNLLGKSHKQYVQDQIKVRQEKLGKTAKDNNDISWMNDKTSWVRLASSVDIKNSIIGQEVTQGTPLTDQVSINPTLTGSFAFQASPQFTTTTTRDIVNSDGNQRLNLLGLDESFMGSTLSQKMVLHGGIEQMLSKDSTSLTKKSGITNNFNSPSLNSISAYSDFGLVAMAGIQSVDIKSKSMGSLREANLSIRVNSSEQLELIETIYLRLGYSLFLEWGNSSYYNNDGEYVKGAQVNPTLLFDFLNPEEKLLKCPQNFIDKIEKAREESNGNYDALFGRVSNFSWEFDPAGFYNVSLTIISWGDVIESLGIDSLYPNSTSTTVDQENSSLLSQYIEASTLPRSFTPSRDNMDVDDINNSDFAITLPGAVKNTLLAIPNVEVDYSKTLNYTRPKYSKGLAISAIANFGENQIFKYTRFGDLLDFINNKLLLYVEDCSTPIIKIKTNTNKLFCYNPKINVSADPSKVMIRRDLGSQGLDYNLLKTLTENIYPDTNGLPEGLKVRPKIFEDKLSTKSGKSYNVQLAPFDHIYNTPEDSNNNSKEVIVGKIMNIYFEKQFIYDTLTQNRDSKTGKVFIFKFLKALLDAANSSLGGVNKLDLRVIDDRILEIYDQVPLYGVKEPEENPTIFNIFGLKKSTGEGSFVTNFGLKTELTNEFATTISIGAQANGSTVGEDSTMLSKWNFGLIDRFYPKKLDSYRKDNQQSTTDPDQEEYDNLLRQMQNLWSDYSLQKVQDKVEDPNWGTSESNPGTMEENRFIYQIYSFPKFQTKSFSEYTKLQKQFFQSSIKLKSKQQKLLSNQIGMLPINLNLEMDGISGIRIYDQIHVDTRFLPSYYPDNLIFIIKGLSQSFNGNRWITKIDTIAQPKVQFGKDLDLSITSPQESNNIGEEVKKLLDNDRIIPFDNNLTITRPVVEPLQIRGMDSFGSGAFGAGRGNRIHYGVDIVTTPGQEIYSPIPGIMRKITSIYPDGSHPELTGIEIAGTGEYLGWFAQILYADMDYYNGFKTKAGYVIGKAQNMAISYGEGMTNHIHFAIYQPSKPFSKRKFVNTEELIRFKSKKLTS